MLFIVTCWIQRVLKASDIWDHNDTSMVFHTNSYSGYEWGKDVGLKYRIM